MAHHTLLRIVSLLAAIAATCADKEQTRWSRQISSYTADIGDWVPLPGPMERELTQTKKQPVAEPRILAEPFPTFTRSNGFNHGGFNQDTFPSRMFLNTPSNRQLYLQSLPSVPSAPQNYLTEQGFGQSIRFGLSQPNFPLNQGFVSQQLNFDSIPQLNTKPQQISHSPQIKFENAPKTSQSVRPQVQPFITQAPILKPEIPKFFDGYRIQNVSNDFNTKRPQSLQKLKYDGVKTETIPQNKPKVEREEVQLLYVPLESLNSGQFNFRTPIATPQVINTDLYDQIQKQIPVNTPTFNKPSVDFQKQITKTVDSVNPRQEISSNFNAQTSTVNQIPKFTTLSSPFPTIPSSTPKPKKLKPHQPPLAIFLTQEARKGHQVKVGDVLYSLKNANTIAVLDVVNPQSAPRVFIGPSSLTPPESYVKFELPYLSNIENIENKLRQLPFFVAPLSYKTPQGFAKIPFPSPHVGSVVINSQINKDDPYQIHSTTLSDFYAYNRFPSKQIQNLETQKPKINYYTTAPPKPQVPSNYEPNYYSFEQQGTRKEPETRSKATSYFLSNIGNQYNPSNYVSFPSGPSQQTPELVQSYPTYQTPTARTPPTQKPTITTTSTTTTTTTTTAKPSTNPSQLLETHNPYSINQAFHFSTPIDYQNFFDEYKENYATPGQVPYSQTQPETNVSSSPVSISEETESIQPSSVQGSPNYLQGYTPEIHYESEVQNSRFPTYDTHQQTNKQAEYSQTNNPVIQYDSFKPSSDLTPSRNVNEQTPTESILSPANPEVHDNTSPESTENHIPVTNPPYDYNQYESSFNEGEYEQSTQSSSTSTTTTTTRKPLLRTRGRPRYPTTKADTGEYTTKQTITRRPLRERRPLQSRTRYEPNKITTEKSVRKPAEPIETTTKFTRTRTRGRVHYRPSDADDIHGKRLRQSSKENDLAYQRDVLHQNYPVTLMEKTSTVDIDATTQPTFRVSSADVRYSEDTENAYSNDKVTVTEHSFNTENMEHEHTGTFSKHFSVPNVLSTQHDENIYESRSSPVAENTNPTYEESKDEETYNKQTTPIHPTVESVTVPGVIEIATQGNEDNVSPTYKYESINEEEEETATRQNIENGNAPNEEDNQQSEQEENVIQTTPSYNRVRVRPGVIRQYHPGSTESSRVRIDRRRPGQAITYRPTFDKRRTTMRIDEIEADLKTKQIHTRPEVQDYRHPVYKPESTTEPTITTPLTQETTKRGLYGRRRPTYTASSTETSTSKKSYDVRNRFRGRRPTQKPSEKPEEQTELTTSTARDTPTVRNSDRPRLSERFNKNPEPEVPEDQDPNYSIQRPNYAVPDSNRWSPKISTNSFKPYNPNDITDETKVPAVDQQSTGGPELDIITAKNEYDTVLISVTPATNNRANKKIPDIPPTLEALVEQSRLTKTDGGDTMSTFESMLEEVMKSLEEQDEDEYTKNVMKHKGGEIGEIPPEKIISPTTVPQDVTTTTAVLEEVEQIPEKDHDRKTRRRGFWKKVKVRPATTESFEVAESQYYSNAVNRLGQPIKLSKTGHEKLDRHDKSKLTVTTYKPTYQFIKELFETDNEDLEITPDIDIPKLTTIKTDLQYLKDHQKTTIAYVTNESTENLNPGDMDLGTGSPESTFGESTHFTTVTEPVTIKKNHSAADRSDGFSFMDYLFGVTSSNNDADDKGKNETKDESSIFNTYTTIETGITEQPKTKTTEETTYIPEEFTAVTFNEADYDHKSTDETKNDNSNKDEITQESTEPLQNHIETSTASSFMDSLKIVSTSMSTEISHETEICFRGKCIKTKKPML